MAMLKLLVNVYTGRIARFVARVLRSMEACWGAWCSSCRQKCLDPISGVVVVETFIEGRSSAATGPLHTWNQFRWLQAHLKAPGCLHPASRPPRRPVSGAVSAENQASVAEPKVILRFVKLAEELERNTGLY